MSYIDSHTHITNEELDTNLYLNDIKSANELGVSKSMLVFTMKEELIALDFLKDNKHFDFAYGIYPEDFKEVKEEDFIELKKILSSYNFSALGEIGLDYHYHPEAKEFQKEYFIRQIEIANEFDLPIIIHTRDAIQDTYDILKKYDCKRKGVLHCYSSSMEMAKEFIKLGYYISFSGTITFKNNKHGPLTAKNIDLNYMLCETDAPYLAPVPKRGEINRTENVIYVYKFLSDLLAIEEEKLKEIIYNNYYRLFKRK